MGASRRPQTGLPGLECRAAFRGPRREQWAEALAGAFEHDSRVLMEERIVGRELTVAVLEGRTLPVVEIRPRARGSYDYHNKYTPGATEYLCPAPLAPRVEESVRDAALGAFLAVGGRDFGRVDVLLRDDQPYVLEVNTLPGMTETSLFPKAAAAAGFGYPELCQRIIDIALDRQHADAATGNRLAMFFKRKSKNRRLEHDFALDVKLRSDKIKARRWRVSLSLLAGSILALSLLLGVWRGGQWMMDRLLYSNSAFAIRDVEISTDGAFLLDQLRRWTQARPGDNLLALDMARVKRDLEMVPYIESATVERILPHTLKVRVFEREPGRPGLRRGHDGRRGSGAPNLPFG